MNFEFRPQGVCSSKITFDINDNVISNIQFQGGCNGNLKAIAKLCEGMKADEIVEKLKGNTCGFKGTSCADQLAKAISEAKNQ